MATTRSKRSSSPRRSSSEGASRRKTGKRSSSSSSSSEGASRRKTGKRRYGKAASKKVERAVHEAKRGKLRSGRSKKKVTSRKQAIAIGLSQARKRGAKVPPRKRSAS
jgi:hypothetical protein